MTPVQTCTKCRGTGRTKIASGKNAGKETDCEDCNRKGKIVTQQSPRGS
jgi:DnaJ-class molecular chaperone